MRGIRLVSLGAHHLADVAGQSPRGGRHREGSAARAGAPDSKRCCMSKERTNVGRKQCGLVVAAAQPAPGMTVLAPGHTFPEHTRIRVQGSKLREPDMGAWARLGRRRRSLAPVIAADDEAAHLRP